MAQAATCHPRVQVLTGMHSHAPQAAAMHAKKGKQAKQAEQDPASTQKRVLILFDMNGAWARRCCLDCQSASRRSQPPRARLACPDGPRRNDGPLA